MPSLSGQQEELSGECVRGVNQMFCVSEAEAEMIRVAFEQGGEFSAAVELRRLFPGITDMNTARRCALTIVGWAPLPATARATTD